MFDSIVKEVRSELAEKGWRLYLYRNLSHLKKYECSGLCDEDEKRLLISMKGKSRTEVLWYIGHELAHFRQLYDYSKEEIREFDRGYRHYTDFLDGKPLYEDVWKKSREMVVEYEFDADRRAYTWLKNHRVSTKGFIQDANAYSYTIRYAFFSGRFLIKGRSAIIKPFNIPERWFSKTQRLRTLKKKEIDFMESLSSY